jgi:hypothetical protein
MVKSKYLNAELEKWYDQLVSLASDGELSEADTQALQSKYVEITNEGNRRYNAAMSVIGGVSGAEVQATQKGLAAMGQGTADELNGKFTTMLIYQDRMAAGITDVHTALMEGLRIQAEIRDNTSYCRRLEAIDNNIAKLREDISSMRESGLKRQ